MSELPSGWALSRIEELIALNPKNDCPDEITAGFVPMPKLGTEFRSSVGFESRPWGEIRKAYTHFADGDVLLAKITPCFENGKAGYVQGMPNGVGAGSSEYFVCRPIANLLSPKILLALFKTEQFLKQAEVEMTGSVGHKRVPKEFLLNTEIPLPPWNEQKRIADKLDAVLARVDACRDRLDRVPTILKRFRQSVLAAATSGKLTEEWRQSVDRDSRADDWPTASLSDVCEKITDGEHISPKTVDHGVPLVSAKDVRDDGVDLTDTKFVSPEFAEVSWKRCNPKLGDVLVVSRGATVGRTCIVKVDARFCLMGSVLLFKPKTAVVIPAYLEIALKSPYGFGKLTTASGASAQSAIYIRDTKLIRIALPTIDEQAEIVRRVESLFVYADQIESNYATARAQVERLTPALLAKAFRGELVPQDPNDEPADKLLERIRTQKNLEVRVKSKKSK